MHIRTPRLGRWTAGVGLLLALWLGLQVAVVVAAGPETYGMPEIVGQAAPTPTPFRFLTPTPFVSRPVTTTTTPPQAGGFPIELALPALAGGLTAIGGGSFLLRRKTNR